MASSERMRELKRRRKRREERLKARVREAIANKGVKKPASRKKETASH